MLQSSAVIESELRSEFDALLQDFFDRYDPQGLAEINCVEMMAMAKWTERRVMTCEVTALNLCMLSQSKQQGVRRMFPDGITGVELTAIAFNELANDKKFYW